MIHRWRAAAVLLALAGTALPAAAQVRGIPVYNSGVPRGLGLYGDVGFANDEAGGGTGYGLTGKAGFGPLGVAAQVSTSKPDGGDSDISVGGSLNYRVFGGPLVPLAVTLQAGAGYVKAGGSDLVFPPSDVTFWHFPVGIGFTLTIPNPVLAIRPWLAPRLDIVRTSPDGGESDTDTNFGLSGGIEANFLNGFGLHAAYDAVFADGARPGIFGLGAHYTFRTPGL